MAKAILFKHGAVYCSELWPDMVTAAPTKHLKNSSQGRLGQGLGGTRFIIIINCWSSLLAGDQYHTISASQYFEKPTFKYQEWMSLWTLGFHKADILKFLTHLPEHASDLKARCRQCFHTPAFICTCVYAKMSTWLSVYMPIFTGLYAFMFLICWHTSDMYTRWHAIASSPRLENIPTWVPYQNAPTDQFCGRPPCHAKKWYVEIASIGEDSRPQLHAISFF